MNCSKCNQPMKEYLGLYEKGWDCTNERCDKISLQELTKIATIEIEKESNDIMDALRYAFNSNIHLSYNEYMKADMNLDKIWDLIKDRYPK